MGLPALLAGAVAVFVSSASRSHEFERERRRRKQDCLERAIEDFDECDSAIDGLHVLSRTYHSFRTNPDLQLRLTIGENLNAAIEKAEAAELRFGRSRSKLSVFGFKACAEALGAYALAVAKEKVALQPLRNGEEGGEKSFAPTHEKRIFRGIAFCSAVEEIFKLL